MKLDTVQLLDLDPQGLEYIYLLNKLFLQYNKYLHDFIIFIILKPPFL